MNMLFVPFVAFALLAQQDTDVDSQQNTIPVIFDTDIGSDIDDTWALAFLLNSPELDVKLVVSDDGDTVYRAKILAKFLEVAGRTDIPVGVGKRLKSEGPYPQGKWVEDYDLTDYPGTVHRDGVQAIIDTIMNSPEPVTLICVGPVPNIAEALEREPRIAENARFVGMHGSVYKGYNNSDTVNSEYNVRLHIPECQRAFAASWDITITPLDTCGIIVLEGDRYAKVRDSETPMMRALMENYGFWLDQPRKDPADLKVKSSVLFDTVAIYLAFSQDLLIMEDLGIRIDDEGFTRIDPEAHTVHVATKWADLDGFYDLLAQRLIAP